MLNNTIKTGDYYVHDNIKYLCTGRWATDIQYQISALKYDFHKESECTKC